MPRVMPMLLPPPSQQHQESICSLIAPALMPTQMITYELRASAEILPLIDCTKGVKNVWLSPIWLARCNTFLYRHKTTMTVSHMLGTLCGIGALYLPTHIARVCSLCSFIFNSPGILVGVLVLRYDMIKVLLRTYEFWYLSMTNALALVLTAIHFDDLRVLALIPAWLGFEITILIDASYRAVNTTMRASVITGLVLFGYMIFAVLGLDMDVSNPPIFRYGTHSVTAVDGITSCLSTVVLMLWRNAVRKYLVLQHKQVSVVDSSTIVARTMSCITYRCRVRLTVMETQESANKAVPRRILVRECSSFARGIAPMAQLMFAKSSEVYDPSCTLFQCLYEPSLLPLHPICHCFLHAIYLVGITVTALVFAANNLGISESSKWALSSLSVAATVVFCGIYALHAQRQLLRRLCTSFDFAFVSVQLSIAHICVCDALCWDVRCLGVLSTWLWVHWVFSVDVITPIIRARLGYTRSLSQLVVVIFVVVHVLLSLELLFWNHFRVQDRAIFSTIVGHHRVEIRVIPVLFGRMITTFAWTLRLLWRLLRRSHDELIMIQGNVIYHDYMRDKKRVDPPSRP